MVKIFSYDNKVVEFLGNVFDLILLNAIFLITCIPIVTIGTSITAMYTVTLKMHKNEGGSVFKEYFKAWKLNFKDSIGIWLGYFVIFMILVLDIRIANINMEKSEMWKVLYIFSVAILIQLWILGAYLFPLISKFNNTAKNSLKNATFLALRHLPFTLMIVILNSLLPIIFIVNMEVFLYALLVYALIGFSLIAYVNSIWFQQIFDKYIEEI